ncbi:MAG: alpha/beta fold hydrolase [Deltaproteobacteria bacterium]
MPLVQTNGIRLNVVELGTGSPVVMLHGLLTGSSASWYFTSAPTLARRHRVLLVDLRGHGRSERPPSGYDSQTLAQDLAGALDAIGWKEPVALVGQSYGALVALRFALERPERVRRLALVEAPLPPSQLPDLQAFFSLEPAKMADALPEVMRHFLDRRGRQAEKLLASLAELSFRTTLLDDVRREPDPPDDELARLRDTLLVYGEQSSCRGVGERLARVIPGAKLVRLPGGHDLHLDSTAALTRVLEEEL